MTEFGRGPIDGVLDCGLRPLKIGGKTKRNPRVAIPNGVGNLLTCVQGLAHADVLVAALSGRALRVFIELRWSAVGGWID